MADIKQAIEYAKKNPNTPFATELRKRIETGQMNKELSEAGLSIPTPESAPMDQAPTGKEKISEAVGDVKEIGTGFYDDVQKRGAKIDEIRTAMKEGKQSNLRSLLQTFGQVAGIGADGIGQVAKGAANLLLSDKTEKKVSEVTGKLGKKVMENQGVQNLVKWYDELPEAQQRDIDAVGGVVNLVSNFVGGEVAGRGGTLLKEATETGIGATRRALVEGAQGIKTAATEGADTILSGVQKGVRGVAEKSGSQVLKDIAGPEVSDAVKVSLNPEQALKGTGQDLMVSVKQGDQTVVKKLSELTPEEKVSVQAETKGNFDSFMKQAEAFKKDRSVPDGSPVEIVGKRADQALEVVDKERQNIGSQMGTIEQKYLENPLPVNETTLSEFSDVIKNFENQKFGVDTGGAPIVRKLVEDFDLLEQGGATVGERLQFVRDWQKYLRDSKDPFGNFKENASANTRIEKAVNTLRDETVDHISEVDEGYKGLRQKYAEYINLEKIGDSLLGKEGAFGERIKGAATVKRAIQSNSDAGARQFLTKLKEITGYDAIKEGDVALTAMDLVGDYQGLSLLNILNEGKPGVIKGVLEKLRDLVVGTDKKRVEEYIKKLEAGK